jgi:hypothetical protein
VLGLQDGTLRGGHFLSGLSALANVSIAFNRSSFSPRDHPGWCGHI